MEEKDLLSSLESLERDLQSVNSAREQVESTVKAYHEVGAKFNDYVSNLKAVSANIATLVETIKNERSAFSSYCAEKARLSKRYNTNSYVKLIKTGRSINDVEIDDTLATHTKDWMRVRENYLKRSSINVNDAVELFLMNMTRTNILLLCT